MAEPGGEKEPHRYTVDVILHGAEPYPCVICGEGRNADVHDLGISIDEVYRVRAALFGTAAKDDTDDGRCLFPDCPNHPGDQSGSNLGGPDAAR